MLMPLQKIGVPFKDKHGNELRIGDIVLSNDVYYERSRNKPYKNHNIYRGGHGTVSAFMILGFSNGNSLFYYNLSKKTKSYWCYESLRSNKFIKTEESFLTKEEKENLKDFLSKNSEIILHKQK